jgi:hypothetical protein
VRLETNAVSQDHIVTNDGIRSDVAIVTNVGPWAYNR